VRSKKAPTWWTAAPFQLLGREPAGPAVAGADPHDVDRAELADFAQLDNRQDQGVPHREAEEADQQQLLQLRPTAGDGHKALPQPARERHERPVQVCSKPIQQRIQLAAVLLGKLLGRDLATHRFGELLLIEQPEWLLAHAGLDRRRRDNLPQLLELGVQVRLDCIQPVPATGVERSEPGIILAVSVIDTLDDKAQAAVGERQIRGAQEPDQRLGHLPPLSREPVGDRGQHNRAYEAGLPESVR
jgi:hypothetical protein